MPHQADIDAMAPALKLTIDYVSSSVRCAGTVDVRTGRHVVEAVEELLTQVPPSVTIDIRELHVADRAGADALLRVQRIVRDAGRRLRWHGFTGDHVGGIVPLFAPPHGQAAVRGAGSDLYRQRPAG